MPTSMAQLDSSAAAASAAVEQESGAVRAVLPAGLIVLLAVELALLAGVTGLYFVARETHPELFSAGVLSADSPRRVERGWLILQTLLVLMAAASTGFAVVATVRRQVVPAMLLWAATVMVGTLILGAVALGQIAEGNDDWQVAVEDVLKEYRADRDASRHAQQVAMAGPPLSVAESEVSAQGDAAAGARAYMASCAACHGPRGEGAAGIGPALLETPFAEQADDSELRRVIVQGRMPGDPASVMQRVMPPRGGNPFLSDEQVTDIIAFLRDAAGGGEAGAAVAADPSELVPRWVIPSPAEGPSGLRSEAHTSTAAPAQRPVLTPDGYVQALRGVFALHVVVAMGIAAWLLVRMFVGRRGVYTAMMARVAGIYWIAAAGAWVIVWSLVFAM